MPQTTTVEITPEQRFQHIAAILAKGVIRFQQRIRHSELTVRKEAFESSPTGLEVLGETRLSVSRA